MNKDTNTSKKTIENYLEVDLHLHTNYSDDARGDPEDILREAGKRDLDVIAITDHNEIKGAFKAEKIADKFNIEIIIGEEVKSRSGIDIIGLFLDEKISKGLSVSKIINKIHDQNGLAMAPHPFSFHRSGIGSKMSEYEFDYIEVFNGLSMFWENNKAKRWSKKLEISGVGGSDAHRPREVGIARTLFENFSEIRKMNPIEKKISHFRNFYSVVRRSLSRI